MFKQIKTFITMWCIELLKVNKGMNEWKQTADSSHVFEDIHTCQNKLIN